MSGKKILKNASLSIGCLVVGGIAGYSINHFHDSGAEKTRSELLKLTQFDNIGHVSIKDISSVATLRTESGENLYALYKENLLGDVSDIRYVLGDGYLVYNSNVMHYVKRPDFKELSNNTKFVSENTNKESKADTVKSYIDNISSNKKKTQEKEEKVEVNKDVSSEKEVDANETSLDDDLEYSSDMSNVDLSQLIIEDYEAEDSNSSNKGNNEGNSFSSINAQNSDSQQELSSGEVRKTEQRRSERVVEDLEFVDNSISGTTRDKMLSESIPDEEKREKFKEEIGSAAEENYRRDAIQKISDRLSDFTIDFESQTGEEKRVITVFTDPTCPFCRRLHGDIERLQLMGYTVRYLLIPRDGMNSPVVPEITYASCFPEEKSRELVNKMFSGNNLDTSNKPESCDSSVIERQLKLATSLGAENTPFIIDNTGGATEGYSGIENMLEKLDASN
jgi:thioredoxin-related protein